MIFSNANIMISFLQYYTAKKTLPNVQSPLHFPFSPLFSLLFPTSYYLLHPIPSYYPYISFQTILLLIFLSCLSSSSSCSSFPLLFSPCHTLLSSGLFYVTGEATIIQLSINIPSFFSLSNRGDLFFFFLLWSTSFHLPDIFSLCYFYHRDSLTLYLFLKHLKVGYFFKSKSIKLAHFIRSWYLWSKDNLHVEMLKGKLCWKCDWPFTGSYMDVAGAQLHVQYILRYCCCCI